MTYSFTHFRSFSIAAIVALLLFCCITINAQPVISSFSPTKGDAGTPITITGSFFNIIPSNNFVLFGAVKATISAATATSITAIVPDGATFGPITIIDTVTGLASKTNTYFTPNFTPIKTALSTTDYAAKINLSTPASSTPSMLAMGDIDCDGKNDLVVVNYGAAKISVFQNTSTMGNLSFTKQDFTTGANPSFSLIGDIDGDGKPEIVVANTGSNTLSIFHNTSSIGAISLATKIDIAAGGSPRGLSLHDLDADGKQDLVVANIGGNIAIFRNISTKGLITASSFSSPTAYAGNSPWNVAVADIDGDGKPDICVANRNHANISVYKNNTASVGSIILATKVDFTASANLAGIATGDIDGDGKIDIAVSNYTSSYGISVFRNLASVGIINSSTFAMKQDFATPAAPIGVVLNDMNGDGKPDIACANYLGGNLSLFKNTSLLGSVSMDTRVDYTGAPNQYGIAVGDLDGDGIPDMASPNYNASNIVGVYRSNSTNVWYSKAASVGTLENTSSWGFNTDGTGTSPEVFNNRHYTFVLSNSATNNYNITNNWLVYGTVNIPSAATLSLASNNMFVGDSLLNNGTITGSGITTLNGTLPQTITGIGTTENLTVDNMLHATIASGSNMQKLTGTLTLTNGSLTTNNNLTFISNVNTTARIAQSVGDVIGNVIIERFIPGGKRVWRFMGHPFNAPIALNQWSDDIDMTGSTGTAGGFVNNVNIAPSAYYYDATIGNSSTTADPGWKPYTSTASTIASGDGLRIFYRGRKGQPNIFAAPYDRPDSSTISITGPFNATGNYQKMLTQGATSGFNLISNPYLSNVNIKNVTKTSNVNNNYWVWVPNAAVTGAYMSYTFGVDDISLPSCGAVLVEANGLSESITFKETDKTAISTMPLLRNTISKGQLEMSLFVDENIWDRWTLFVNAKATSAMDKIADAVKFKNADANLYSLSSDNKALAVDVRPIDEETIIPLGFTSSKIRTYTIKIKVNELDNYNTLYLHDKYLNKEILLANGIEYTFSTDANTASYNTERFELIAKKVQPITNGTNYKLRIFPNPATEIVTIQFNKNESPTTVRLINVAGKIVKTINTYNNGNGIVTIPVKGIQKGIYTIEVMVGKEITTSKLIIQ